MGASMDVKCLLDLIKDRNAIAFRQLYDYYQPRLMRVVKKLLQEEEAHDLVQDVFIKIWQTPEDFDNAERLEAYLYRTTRNYAINALNRSLAEKQRKLRFAREMPQQNDAVKQYLDRRDLERIVDNTIKLMPERQAEVYRLSLQEDLGYKEIAIRLGKSPDTVRVQLIAAKKIMRDYLKGNYHLNQALLISCAVLMV